MTIKSTEFRIKWFREEARKLGFSTVIGKFDKAGNRKGAFVTVICERRGSYTEYKKLTQCEISGSVKCECPFQLIAYLLIAGDWSLRVGDGRHNHDIEDVLKGHKTAERLNPNECIHLHEMAESSVPPRQIPTKLRKRNNNTLTTIKHVYNACHLYR
jgi:hypothetical protein